MKKHRPIFIIIAAAVAAVLFSVAAGDIREYYTAQNDIALSPVVGQIVNSIPGLVPETAAGAADEDPTEAKNESAAVSGSTEAVTEAEPSTSAGPVVKSTDIEFGVTYTDSVFSKDDEHWYDFSLNERGALRITLSASSKQNLSGRVIELFNLYYPDGNSGEKKLRLLDTLNTFSMSGTTQTQNIGLERGEYRIRVTSGDVTAISNYHIQVDFSPRTDYEIECNDTPSRYTEIYSGIQTRGSASFNPDGTDIDWYMFRMYYDGALDLIFRHSTGKYLTTAFKITLYDEQFEELFTGVSTFDLGTLKSGKIGVESGIYYVCVENRVYYDGDYGLTVTRTPGGNYETENNDEPSSADIVEPSEMVNGALTVKNTRQDVDWFKGKMPYAGFVKVSLSVNKGEEEKNSIRMTVLSSSGKELYSCLLSAAAGSAVTPEIGLPEGDFYIRIDNEGLYKQDGEYVLGFSSAEDGSAETEPNLEPSLACMLTEGVAMNGVVADGENGYDTDYYSFELDEDASVEIVFEHPQYQDDKCIYMIGLSDSDLAPVPDVNGENAAEINSGAAETVVRYALSAGKYYIKINSGLFSNDGKYSIKYTVA